MESRTFDLESHGTDACDVMLGGGGGGGRAGASPGILLKINRFPGIWCILSMESIK